MSKAFLKEADTPDPRCPGADAPCGALGESVGQATLRTHVAVELPASFRDGAYFCPSATCSIAYFHPYGGRIDLGQLRAPVWPKDPGAPLCACLGVAAAAIAEDAEAGRRERIREILACAEGSSARCVSRAANGRSCATEARRVFLAHYAG